MFVESQRVHIQSTCKVCNKNLECCSIKYKKYIYCCLKCIVYDKLLKPRQSFLITLYLKFWTCKHIWFYYDLALLIWELKLSSWAVGLQQTHSNNVHLRLNTDIVRKNVKISLYRPWGFQKLQTPRFQDNGYMKVVRLSALCTDRLYPPVNISSTHFR